MSNNNAKIAQFSNQKYVNLETYRKNGQAVQTPVGFVIDNGQISIRTDGNSGKIKNVRRKTHMYE
jgi:PPOX class probable F420-dependent enzyme